MVAEAVRPLTADFWEVLRGGTWGPEPGTAVPDADPATERLLPFVERLFPTYRVAPHHRVIAEALEAVERGDERFLVITVPPRHGKSELASVNFPAWYLGRNPDKRIIACSHTASLAYRFSRYARSKVRAPRWPFVARLSRESRSIQSWDIEGHRGGYLAAGVGGAITGSGGHLLLIDDPVKNAEEANSAVFRENAWEWFTGTAFTRLEERGAVVLIGTRWHEDDLIGRALAAEPDRWTVIDLPARARDEADPLGREPGAPLWPEKYDDAALAEIERTVGPYNWTAQYQCRPVNPEGAVVPREWWGYIPAPELTNPPAYASRVVFCDTAFKAKQHSDYSVLAVWGKRPGGYDVLDVWRGRAEFPELQQACAALRAKHNPHRFVVEDKASGQSLVQVLRKQGFPVEPYAPGTADKTERLKAVTGYLKAGLVRLDPRGSWVEDFVNEHALFPRAEHDDQVDTTSMALMWFEVAPPQEMATPVVVGRASGWGFVR